jgi:chloramphenicol O-acetyltransferase
MPVSSISIEVLMLILLAVLTIIFYFAIKKSSFRLCASEKEFFSLYIKVADLEQENEELLRMMGAAKIIQNTEDYEKFKQQYRENITKINEKTAKMDEILVRDRNI